MKYQVQIIGHWLQCAITTTTTTSEQATARCFDMKRSSEAAGVEMAAPHHYIGQGSIEALNDIIDNTKFVGDGLIHNNNNITLLSIQDVLM